MFALHLTIFSIYETSNIPNYILTSNLNTSYASVQHIINIFFDFIHAASIINQVYLLAFCLTKQKVIDYFYLYKARITSPSKLEFILVTSSLKLTKHT